MYHLERNMDVYVTCVDILLKLLWIYHYSFKYKICQIV